MRTTALCILGSLAAFGSAHADPIALYIDDFAPAEVEALEAEAAVRGTPLRPVNVGDAPPDGHVVIRRDGDTLIVEADGARSESLLGYPAPSPRALAAMASGMLDATASVDVDVDVRVRVRPSASSSEARLHPGEVASAVPVATAPASTWYLDVGGLATPVGVYSLHGGVGHLVSPNVRAEVMGHLAFLPDDGMAAAASVEASRIWGQTLRIEAGVRALAVAIRDNDSIRPCILPEGCGTQTFQNGVGAGVFFGLGTVTRLGTLYARGGADLVQFEEEEKLALTPSGAVGIELPL